MIFLLSTPFGNHAFGATPPEGEYSIATLAGGCFWCVEADLEKVEGVQEAISGYAGSDYEEPTYEEVSTGKTGHVEAVQVYFDPSIVSYESILDIFLKNINPTDSGGQFNDRGNQYRPVIFYHSPEQEKEAEKALKRLEASGFYDAPITVEVTPFSTFYHAEDYHQDYAKNNPVRYKVYRGLSGRDAYVKEIQENGQERALREKLTPMQYWVTQENGTEPPFQNAYWNNEEEGIYVDLISGEVLFSSNEQYLSESGWPSFTHPLEAENIVLKKEWSLLLGWRTEVRSKKGNAHLGHVFSDGPPPDYKRWCINSAALRFIPAEELENEGYSSYRSLFE